MENSLKCTKLAFLVIFFSIADFPTEVKEILKNTSGGCGGTKKLSCVFLRDSSCIFREREDIFSDYSGLWTEMARPKMRILSNSSLR